jgi:gluconate 5-dehydrogenase
MSASVILVASAVIWHLRFRFRARLSPSRGLLPGRTVRAASIARGGPSSVRSAEISIHDLFDLTGSTAIVTGGGVGLGTQVAEALAEVGANVAVCSRDLARCEAMAARLTETYGGRALGLRCDLREHAEILETVQRVGAELGPIDILVNNAGTSWGAPTLDYTVEAWQRVIDVNLTGMWQFCQAVAREMVARGRGGRIINFSSVAAIAAEPAELMDSVAYNAAKGGVLALTRDLAVKWARHGIRVNTIAPGWFPTNMSRVLLEHGEEAFLNRIPLRRFGGPEDLKGAVVLLASRASDFMTGSIIMVDGGQAAS